MSNYTITTSAHLTDAEIILNDINEAAAKRTEAVANAFIAEHGLKQTVRVESDLAKALVGTDFVVISIEVGDRFKLWDMDWKIPQQWPLTRRRRSRRFCETYDD